MSGVDPIIEVSNLKVIYNKGKSNEVRSLDDVSVKIYPQEYVIFFGPSGCGKSTLLYSISGLQAPTEGHVAISGKKINEMNKKEIVELHQVGTGMVFQAFYLIPSLNVLDNVCLPKVFRGESKTKRKETGIKLLHRFGIVEQSSKFPSQLSGGQKQRVSIARSLVNNPQIILADEPVGNLDSESAVNVLRILKELNEIDKKTVILVTHNAEHLHYADRIVYLKDGKIIKEEVNKDKRPIGGESDINDKVKMEELTTDLKILMRTFKNLSTQQIGALLVPFKANQLMSHVLSNLAEEQVNAASGFLKELLFGNINVDNFQSSLDLSYERGGAGWNKHRANSFAARIAGILKQVDNLTKRGMNEGISLLSKYLMEGFNLNFTQEEARVFESFLKMRIENKFDRIELQQKLDVPKSKGGMGLHKNTAEKVSRELEIIMLIKYSV